MFYSVNANDDDMSSLSIKTYENDEKHDLVSYQCYGEWFPKSYIALEISTVYMYICIYIYICKCRSPVNGDFYYFKVYHHFWRYLRRSCNNKQVIAISY